MEALWLREMEFEEFETREAHDLRFFRTWPGSSGRGKFVSAVVAIAVLGPIEGLSRGLCWTGKL